MMDTARLEHVSNGSPSLHQAENRLDFASLEILSLDHFNIVLHMRIRSRP
jgi:hypothetical protein